jgi:Ni,Fe-hydrogenase III small subunit
VSGFTYPSPTEATVLLQEDLDVVLERDGRPVMMSGPRFDDPDLGDPRVVSQDFLVAVGSDWDSLAERRALFLNAASWLMRLGDCDSLGLEVTTDRIPSSVGVGEVVRVSTEVIQVGGCDRGAILFSNIISSGFEVVGFQVESVEPSNATNLVRMERTADGVLTRFARTKDAAVFRLVYDLVPMETGLLTNHMAIRFNPYYAAQPVAEQVFSVGTSDCASQTVRVGARTTPSGALELVVAGSGPCTFQIQTSADLQTWKAGADVNPSVSGTVVPLGPIDSEVRFYRVVPKP